MPPVKSIPKFKPLRKIKDRENKNKIATFQLQQSVKATSKDQMIQFIMNAIQFGLDNGGTRLAFSKRGSFVPKCRKDRQCPLMLIDDDIEFGTTYENSLEAIEKRLVCQFRHDRESHAEF